MKDYEIEELILQLLLKNEELRSMIGEKIFPVYIEEKTEGDAVFYDSEMDDPRICKMGVATRIMHYYVCAVSTRMDNANKIIGIIQDIIEGTWKDPYMNIRAVGSVKDSADFKYAKTMEFIIEW